MKLDEAYKIILEEENKEENMKEIKSINNLPSKVAIPIHIKDLFIKKFNYSYKTNDDYLGYFDEIKNNPKGKWNCVDYSVYGIGNLKNGTIIQLGFKNKNVGRYHLVPLYKFNNLFYIVNYLGINDQETKIYYSEDKDELIESFCKYFIPKIVIHNNYELDDEENKFEYKTSIKDKLYDIIAKKPKITQKEFLNKIF